jgi:hypothetical protein
MQAALGAIGQGEFAHQGSISGALRGQTGFGLAAGPSQEQLTAATVIMQLQKQIADAKRAGNTDLANQTQKALDRYMQRHYTYVK